MVGWLAEGLLNGRQCRHACGYDARMTSAFADLQPAPPDSILGLAEAFRADPRPGKISLASGVFVDERGITPVLDTVTEAEQRILDAQTTKLYKPIVGDPAYTDAVRDLLFGADHPLLAAGRVQTLHAPGGTGALRVAADLFHRLRPEATVWLSTPTWPNHPQVFAAAGLQTRAYSYLHPTTGGLDLAALIGSLVDASPGDVVVLHGCCHNPSGVDPTPEQWAALAVVLRDRELLPLVDFAYQGFGDGLREDARGLLAVAAESPEFLVASSFSKNFALYAERVGALSIVGADAREAEVLMSHAKSVVRSLYSNPPAHGGEVVATILLDPALRGRWEAEVAGMRDRINGNRERFVDGLRAADAPFDPTPLLRQRGMFSLLDMTVAQVFRLRDEAAIYLVGAGRVNVAGLTTSNLEPVCAAIAAVMRGR
jgi:aspartate/tyrosine/aromatic aminotransferase